jgi:phage tail sheath gpL-like
MPLTNIGNRKTPSTPIEITFGAQPTATGVKVATLLGHRAASGGTGTNYQVHQVQNVGDPTAAKTEVDSLAGTGSEIGKMVEAFVKGNSAVAGRANFPPMRVVLLPSSETGFGPADEALEAVKLLRSDLLVSPYDANDAVTRNKLRDFAALLSGPDRDLQGQFGSHCVIASLKASATSLVYNIDNQFVIVPWLQDTAVTPAQPVALVAAASAAVLLQNAFPYLPLGDFELGGILPPASMSDRIEAGPFSLSELALAAGLCPLKVDASGRVKFIRTVTTRVTTDGSIPATAYFDYQDLSVLNDFREDCFKRINAPDLKPKKASVNTAKLIKDEILRIAKAYESAEAFQRVNELAKEFKVQPSATSRGRFDFKIPVNVVPGLYVVAGNIEATTKFDEFTL